MTQKIIFKVEEREYYSIVTFELAEPLTPSDLTTIKPPEINFKKGVIISGRGPIWLYCYLSHYYHPALFVATYDPRLGAIITQTHSANYKVGDIIQI